MHDRVHTIVCPCMYIRSLYFCMKVEGVSEKSVGGGGARPPTPLSSAYGYIKELVDTIIQLHTSCPAVTYSFTSSKFFCLA